MTPFLLGISNVCRWFGLFINSLRFDNGYLLLSYNSILVYVPKLSNTDESQDFISLSQTQQIEQKSIRLSIKYHKNRVI